MKIRKVPILTYHAIQPKLGPAEHHPIGEAIFILSQTNFERQMQHLAQAGYQTISLQRLIDFQPDTNLPDKPIIITFDDGHISNYTIAYPILKKYNFTATFFVTAGQVGKPSRLSWQHIKEMLANGMDVGSHGLTHTYPPQLNEDRLTHELAKSKSLLEQNLGRAIKFFAVPTGHHNKAVLRIAREVGYQAVCTSIVGGNHIAGQLFLLRRLTIKSGMRLKGFKQLVQLHQGIILYYRTAQVLRNLFRKLFGFRVYQSIRTTLLALRKS